MEREINTAKCSIIAVKVPNNVIDLGRIGTKLFYGIGFPNPEKIINIGFNFEILGLSSEITEEQAKNIVDEKPYFNYNHPFSSNSNECFCKTAVKSLQTLLQANKVYEVNPYSYSGNIKPIGDVEVSYDKGLNWDNSVEWQQKRICMMVGIAGGNGYFGEGWGTSPNSNTGIGLICASPDYWRKTNELDLWNAAQQNVGTWLLIKKV